MQQKINLIGMTKKHALIVVKKKILKGHSTFEEKEKGLNKRTKSFNT